MRVFVAIDLPEHVKAEIFHEEENLRKQGYLIGTFTARENFHLTLKFLGDIPEEKIEEVKKKLSEVKFKKFDAKIGKIGFFPNENFIKIIWAGFESADVEEFQKKIEEKLKEFPSAFEKFSSHITLARVKGTKKRKELKQHLEKINFRKLDFEVKEFVLMKSEVRQEGPTYKILEKYSLE